MIIKSEHYQLGVQTWVSLSPNTSIQKRALKFVNLRKQAPETSEGIDTTWFPSKAIRVSTLKVFFALGYLRFYRLYFWTTKLDCSHKSRIDRIEW